MPSNGVRRNPNWRPCPVKGCHRGYFIDKNKGCADHREAGLRMYRAGTHPESPPRQAVKRRRLTAGRVVMAGVLAWWGYTTFLVPEQPPEPPTLRPATVVLDFDTDTPGGESCGADAYVNVNGDCIPGPVQADTPPPGATARCGDGTYSFSQSRQGTCSHHGGVASWLG